MFGTTATKAFTVFTGLLALIGGVSAEPADSNTIDVAGGNGPITNSSDTAPPTLHNKGAMDPYWNNDQKDFANGTSSGALGWTDATGIATKVAIGAAAMAYGAAVVF